MNFRYKGATDALECETRACFPDTQRKFTSCSDASCQKHLTIGKEKLSIH